MPLQPCGPFWVMEYVSKTNQRKDYEKSMPRYENERKVPYYLMFLPEAQELTLYRYNGKKYLAVPPYEKGQCTVPEIEMTVGMIDDWVRFWYQGELLPLPAEIQSELDAAKRNMNAANERAERAEAELTRLREQLRKLRGE